MGGRLGIAHETAYCAAKFALCGWSEAMALDLWDTRSEVRLIQPGPIDTEIWDQPDNDPPSTTGRWSHRRSWPRASSPPSRATASSTTCPT